MIVIVIVIFFSLKLSPTGSSSFEVKLLPDLDSESGRAVERGKVSELYTLLAIELKFLKLTNAKANASYYREQ